MAQGLQHSTGVAQGYGMVPYGIPGVFGNAGYGVQGQGFGPQGFAPQGFGPQGFGPQGLGGITPWMQGGGLSHTDGLDRDNLARQMMGNPWLATFPYAQWNATPYGW
jgi:hypothetical protein